MSGRKRAIALLTSSELPSLSPDDRLLLEPLAARELAVTPAVWSDPSIDWARFDAVVVRSPWDWYRRPEEFQAWLASVDRDDVRILNPAALMRAHLDKGYLRGLAARGIAVVETTWVPRGEAVDLDAWLGTSGATEGVLKPSLSAGAHRTTRFDRRTVAEAARALSAITAVGEAMVQPFAREIETEGELSFVFFDGVFHHAVRKSPARGDFRVQAEHGGSTVLADVTPAAVAQATAALSALAEGTLYARVDGILRGGALVLMELEVVEPELFFRLDPSAAEDFADAVVRRLSA